MSEELMAMIESLVQEHYGTQGLEYLRQRTSPAPAVQVPEGLCDGWERSDVQEIIDELTASSSSAFLSGDYSNGEADRKFIHRAIVSARVLLDTLLKGDFIRAAAPAPAPVATEAVAQEPVLTKPARVGNTGFGVGVKERLVIERAQREHEYHQSQEPAIRGKLVMDYSGPQATLSAVAQGGGVDAIVRAFNAADGRKLDSDARALLASAPAVPVGDDGVVIPAEALRWLFGVGRDAFTEPANAIGKFWWRHVFADKAGIDIMSLIPPAPAATKREGHAD